MSETIKDGTGSAFEAKVDPQKQLHVHSVQLSEETDAAERGFSYNINTGTIQISGASASALLYFKNEDTLDFVITAIALGVGTGTASDSGVLTFINNPTAGDIISDGTAVDMKQNRNAGSARTLSSSSSIFKGKDGGTITGGNDVAQFFQTTSGRLFATFPFIVPKGQAIGMKYDPNLSAGNVNVYAALVGYLRSPED